MEEQQKKKLEKMGRITIDTLFGSKRLLVIFYFGLALALLCYSWVFMKELLHLLINVNSFNKETVMLAILELVDMVMIANLVKMIITESYNSFISKAHGHANENSTSGMLKIKMSTAVIGVASINLLQTYVAIKHLPGTSWEDLHKQLAIFVAFLLGAITLSIVEYLHDRGESLKHK